MRSAEWRCGGGVEEDGHLGDAGEGAEQAGQLGELGGVDVGHREEQGCHRFAAQVGGEFMQRGGVARDEGALGGQGEAWALAGGQQGGDRARWHGAGEEGAEGVGVGHVPEGGAEVSAERHPAGP